MAVKIQQIQEGSPAHKGGLCAGEALVSVNGHEIQDGLDYGFHTAASSLELVVQGEKGRRSIHIEKGEYEDLGCIFASYLIDKQHSCKNKCIFCFVDQTPAGMRESLYFKDDDERLSFLFGNYVTLTNLTLREVERIIEMKIQPVNISVHTTNPQLRARLMKNPAAGRVLDYIPMLAKAGISMNCQLVLMPGVNDGPELSRSVEDLRRYYPQIESVAAVPVGLTKHRRGLPEIKPYDKSLAAAQLKLMLALGDACKKELGSRFVFPSDEWFLLAGRPLPSEEFYEGYPQLENGVGMWRLFYDDFAHALQETKHMPKGSGIDVVTGALAGPLMQELAAMLAQKFAGAHMHVHVVLNDFFGHGITVAGLLTGQDVIRQLKGRLKSGILVMPASMFRAEGDLMLDNVSRQDLEKALGVRVVLNTGGAQGLLDVLANTERNGS